MISVAGAKSRQQERRDRRVLDPVRKDRKASFVSPVRWRFVRRLVSLSFVNLESSNGDAPIADAAPEHTRLRGLNCRGLPSSRAWCSAFHCRVIVDAHRNFLTTGMKLWNWTMEFSMTSWRQDTRFVCLYHQYLFPLLVGAGARVHLSPHRRRGGGRKACKEVGFPATIKVKQDSEFVSGDVDLYAY